MRSNVKYLKIIESVLIISLLQACASVSTSHIDAGTRPSITEGVKASTTNISSSRNEWTEKVKQMEGSKDDPSRIVGSSKIVIPSEHHRKTYFLYGAEHLKLENYYFDIPVVYNDAVKKWINYFLNRGRGFFERYGARAGRYAPLLGKILDDMGLPRDLIFLAMAESGFQNNAKSWAKAVGPWQFMPYTGKRYGLAINWFVDERRDPIRATIAAAKYLKKLYEEFGSWELAAAAYNAGEGKVGRAIRKYQTENFWNLRKGRYLRNETKNYVPKIMALAILGKNLKSFGFEEIDFHEPIDFQEIKIAPSTDLIKLSEALSIDFNELQRLNPEVLRWFSSPDIENYTLRIPVGSKEVWDQCCQNMDFKATDFQVYQVRSSNSSLDDVAKKFKIKSKEVLSTLNSLKWNQPLAKNQVVLLPFRKDQNLKAPMYSDLYERPRRSVIRRRSYGRRISQAKKRGRPIANPRTYVVQKGDSLWSVSRKTGTQLDNLIVSNIAILAQRQIRVGDQLSVK